MRRSIVNRNPSQLRADFVQYSILRSYILVVLYAYMRLVWDAGLWHVGLITIRDGYSYATAYSYCLASPRSSISPTPQQLATSKERRITGR